MCYNFYMPIPHVISAKGISGITAYIITGTQILSSSTLTPLFSCITEHISSLFEDRLHVNYCYLLAYKIIQEKIFLPTKTYLGQDIIVGAVISQENSLDSVEFVDFLVHNSGKKIMV
ncbi:hypothetical protein ACJX0J_009412, partial [Zea mays]